MLPVPISRTFSPHEIPPKPKGDFVVYWMNANRRTAWNFSLQQAIYWAEKLNKPLVILETYICDVPWASERSLHFVLQGMQDNANSLEHQAPEYYPCVLSKTSELEILLDSFLRHACVVICDDFPTQPLNDRILSLFEQHEVRLELVDSNGIVPMRATDKVFSRAFDFRRFLQKSLIPHLEEFPEADPLQKSKLNKLKTIPSEICRQFPKIEFDSTTVSDLTRQSTVDHSVAPIPMTPGGCRAVIKQLQHFKSELLASYQTERNQPEKEVTSGLAPYLHFGHISTHQIFFELTQYEHWTPFQITNENKGKSEGWWGCSPALEAFLDQLITWRELGYNMCSKRHDYAEYSSLPDWCQETLAQHASDPRSYLYDLEQFESASTHDELWNAAQRQLVREGRIHNYLRMLWGKKILEWSESPQEALEIMIELNNKYALDGCDPNSYSGIFWILGRYDRAWGPERPVFGKIRYMSSENTARKVKVRQYIKHYSSE